MNESIASRLDRIEELLTQAVGMAAKDVDAQRVRLCGQEKPISSDPLLSTRAGESGSVY